MSQVRTTVRYDDFHILPGNREINQAHVLELIESFGKANLFDAHPVVVNEKMEVIDGQHRLEAARIGSLRSRTSTPRRAEPAPSLLRAVAYTPDTPGRRSRPE